MCSQGPGDFPYRILWVRNYHSPTQRPPHIEKWLTAYGVLCPEKPLFSFMQNDLLVESRQWKAAPTMHLCK